MAFKAEDIEDAPRVHTASSLPSSSPTRSPSHPSPHGILGRLRSYESYLDAKLGIETQGSERVLPHERQPPATWVMFAMWASATMNLSCFATGFLGLQFGLDLAQSIPIVVCASFLGACITGWCATLGAPTGLRQVSISRYSFGWWPSKLVAFLNVVEQLGWSSVGCITGGLALTAVSDGRVSLVLGVVIIAVVGLVFSFVGLKAVMQYEQFAWMVFFVIFMVMYGEAAPKADAQLKSELSGLTLSGTVLNLLAVVYGSSASWSSIVSDYYVQVGGAGVAGRGTGH
jgi:purine-cytosine permease-like protein